MMADTALPFVMAAEANVSAWEKTDSQRFPYGCLYCQQSPHGIPRSASEPDLLALARRVGRMSQGATVSSDRALLGTLVNLQRPRLAHRSATDVPYLHRPDASFPDGLDQSCPGTPDVRVTKPRKMSIIWADELPGASLAQHNQVRFPRDLRSEVADPTVWKKKHTLLHDSYFQGSPYWTRDDEYDRKDDNKAWLQKAREWSLKGQYSAEVKGEVHAAECWNKNSDSDCLKLEPSAMFSHHPSKNAVSHLAIFKKRGFSAVDHPGRSANKDIELPESRGYFPTAQLLHGGSITQQQQLGIAELPASRAEVSDTSAQRSRLGSHQEVSNGTKSQSAKVINFLARKMLGKTREETQLGHSKGLIATRLACDRETSKCSQKPNRQHYQAEDPWYGSIFRSGSFSAPTDSSVNSTPTTEVSTRSALCSAWSHDSSCSRRTAPSTSTGTS